MDLNKKKDKLEEQSSDADQRINKMRKGLQDLQELCDEFNGYCSDEQENNLVLGLINVDLRHFEIQLSQLGK